MGNSYFTNHSLNIKNHSLNIIAMRTFSNVIEWFEIPVRQMARAKKFYETIFDTTLLDQPLNNELKMALFPTDGRGVGGALCEHPDFYHPGHHGPLLYLNAEPDLASVLKKVAPAGGKIIIEKRLISPEHGYMAVIEDSEGNRIALRSEQ